MTNCTFLNECPQSVRLDVRADISWTRAAICRELASNFGVLRKNLAFSQALLRAECTPTYRHGSPDGTRSHRQFDRLLSKECPPGRPTGLRAESALPDPTRPNTKWLRMQTTFSSLDGYEQKTAWHESSPKHAREVMPCH